MNKFIPGPESTGIFYPIPRKYPSKLHKKFVKLEKQFDKAVSKPVLQARLLRAAEAVWEKIKPPKKEEDEL